MMIKGNLGKNNQPAGREAPIFGSPEIHLEGYASVEPLVVSFGTCISVQLFRLLGKQQGNLIKLKMQRIRELRGTGTFFLTPIQLQQQQQPTVQTHGN